MVDRYRGPNGAPARAAFDPERPRRGDGQRRDRRDRLGRARARSASTRSGSRRSTRTPTAGSPAPTATRTRATTATGRSTPRATEPTMAPEADIDTLIATAHAHDMRVLFDVVPNHVHEQHPYAQAHLNGGWFNHPDGTCICGDDVRLDDAHHRLLVRRLPPGPRLAEPGGRRPGHERRPLVDRPLRRRRHPHRRRPDDVARRDPPDRHRDPRASTTTRRTRSSSSARTSSARTTSISSSTSSAPTASTASSTSRSCGRCAARSPTRPSR